MTEKSASDTTGVEPVDSDVVEPVDSDVVEPVDSDVFATAAFAKMAEDWAGFSGIFGLLVLVYVVGLVADAHWAGATQCALTAVATWRLVAVCHVVRRARIVLLSMAGAAVVVSLLGLAGTRDFSAALSSSLLVVLFFFLEVAILRHVFRMPVVNVGVVIGSLCMYVMLGIMFANLYLVVQAVSGQDFFVTGRGTQSDFLYFSFVTETTTGYGDYTAAGKLGRTLAITEAMIGQILLVTLVARFVGSFGTRRPVRDDRGDDTDPPGAAPAEPVGD